MAPHHKFAFLHIFLLAVSGVALGNFVPADHSVLHMSLAGFFIGTYAVFGKEVVKLAIGSWLARKLPRLDRGTAANLCIFVSLGVFAAMGLISWIVSWTATTGVVFGFAVFLSALMADFGIGPLFAEFISARQR